MQLKKLERAVTRRIRKLQKIPFPSRKTVKIIFSFLFILIILSLSLYGAYRFLPGFLKKVEKNISTNKYFLQMAEESYAKGHLENSALYYRNYLNTSPGKRESLLALNKLFEISIFNKKYNEGFKYLNEILTIDKKNYQSMINLLRLNLRIGDINTSGEVVKHYLKYLKKSPEFIELVAVYYMTQGDYRNALKHLYSIKVSKRSSEFNKKIISCLIRIKKYQEAIDYSNTLIPKAYALDDTGLLNELNVLSGIACLGEGKISRAGEYISSAVNSSGIYDHVSLYLMIFVYLSNNNNENLNRLLEDNSQTIEKNQKLLEVLGNGFYFMQNFDRAFYYYELLDNTGTNSQTILNTYADAGFKSGKHIETIEILKRITTGEDFNSTKVYKNLAYLYGKTGNKTEEIFFLKELYNKNADIDLLFRLGLAYYETENYHNGISIVNAALNTQGDPNDPIYKKLTALKTAISEKSNIKREEVELLTLRENVENSFESYIFLVKHYIDKMSFIEARRELNTIYSMKLSENQKRIISFYELIIALKTNNTVTINETRKIVLGYKPITYQISINQAILYILDMQYKKALKLLEQVNTNLSDDEISKIYYLRAVCLYYERDFYAAKRMTEFARRKKINSLGLDWLETAIDTELNQ